MMMMMMMMCDDPMSRKASNRRSPLPGTTWMAGRVPAEDPGWLYLPGTPWSMRLGRGSGGRSALEVYAAGSLIDVMVTSSRASQLLRGACTAVVAGHTRAIAWGCLPTAWSELPTVEFVRGLIHRRAQLVQTKTIAGWYWFADTNGRFSQVVVTSRMSRESCRIRRADTC